MKRLDDDTYELVEYQASPGSLDLGLGVLVPLAVSATVRRPAWRFCVRVQLVAAVEGSEVVVVEVRGDPGHSVSTSDLRSVAVDHVVRFVQLASLVQRSGTDTSWMIDDVQSLSPADRLERTATVYRLATVFRANTVEWVADNLGVSRATAGRMIRRARDAGLLGIGAVR